jgi:hypothetical protein
MMMMMVVVVVVIIKFLNTDTLNSKHVYDAGHN